jgi:1-pyrroline-4-hydroxy-2-carboxylate deaminase
VGVVNSCNVRPDGTDSMEWKGVIPAVTTPFAPDLSVELGEFGRHCRWLVDRGCHGVVVLGSLGEGATLTREEKRMVIESAVKALEDRGLVIAAVASPRTSEAVELAEDAGQAGAAGLMVLPPHVYRGDWRETREHFGAVLRATAQPCMLYNNPIAYGTDVLPEQLLQLATDHPTLAAVKESSADVRRITAIRALLGGRLAISVGVDDAVLEGMDAGATSWVAGLANAFPDESVELFRQATEGRRAEAFELYRWFLPLLRMDSSPKFVQLIKLLQAEMGHGNPRVRPPRLELEGEEHARAIETLQVALRTRPIGLPSG